MIFAPDLLTHFTSCTQSENIFHSLLDKKIFIYHKKIIQERKNTVCCFNIERNRKKNKQIGSCKIKKMPVQASRYINKVIYLNKCPYRVRIQKDKYSKILQ